MLANQSRYKGFTLLELLVVLSIIAIMSTIGLFSYEGTQDEAKVDSTKFEMQEIKKALLQFRGDNGTFPCTVINEAARAYQLDVTEVSGAKKMLPLDNAEALPAASAALADQRDWCEQHALLMLRIFPYDERGTAVYTGTIKSSHPLWNPDSKRGWRGPYLSSAEALTDAWGKPYELYDLELDFHPQRKYCDTNFANVATTLGECRAVDEVGYDEDIHIVPGNVARIVSGGPDGVIGSTPKNAEPDPAVHCQPDASSANGRDDIVLCLLQ